MSIKNKPRPKILEWKKCMFSKYTHHFLRLDVICFVLVAVLAIYIGKCYLSVSSFSSSTNNGQKHWPIVQDWEQIFETQVHEKFFVYSAFYDYLGGDAIVKVLGATTPKIQTKFYCHLFDNAREHYETVTSTLQITRHASRELQISPVTIFCKLAGLKYLPSFVSLSPDRALSRSRIKLIPVIYNKPNDLERGDKNILSKTIGFAACVQPTYEYDDVWQFLQWIEFQMIMGVEHFTFYNISIGPQTSCLIKNYNMNAQTGPIIKVLPWQNIRQIPELHNNGQVVQATDCAARFKNKAKFVVILDYDEYIIPRQNLSQQINNYNQLVQFSLANLEYKGHIPVQFQFRSGLFGLGWPAYQNAKKATKVEDKITNKLYLLKHVTRLKHIEPFNYRAKFITMPDFVTEPGIHSMVHALPKNGIELLVPETVAYVHHYRKCNWAEDCAGKETEQDKTGHAFIQQLLPRVVKRYQSVKDLCGIKL